MSRKGGWYDEEDDYYDGYDDDDEYDEEDDEYDDEGGNTGGSRDASGTTKTGAGGASAGRGLARRSEHVSPHGFPRGPSFYLGAREPPGRTARGIPRPTSPTFLPALSRLERFGERSLEWVRA